MNGDVFEPPCSLRMCFTFLSADPERTHATGLICRM